MRGYICCNKTYIYNNHYFEYGGSIGVWPLKKNGDPKKSMSNKFLNDIDQFFTMTDKEKESFRVGGGCIPFGG